MLIFQWLNNGIKMLHAKGFSSRPSTPVVPLQDLQRLSFVDLLPVKLPSLFDALILRCNADFSMAEQRNQDASCKGLLFKTCNAPRPATLCAKGLSSKPATLHRFRTCNDSNLLLSASSISILQQQQPSPIALLCCHRSSSQIKLHLPSLFYAVKFLLL